MKIYILTILILAAAILISNGRAIVFIRKVNRAAHSVVAAPGRLQARIYARYLQRSQEEKKPCPCCESSMIRVSDSICRHCKLEVSMGVQFM